MPGSLNIRIRSSPYVLLLLVSITMLACLCVLTSHLPPVYMLALIILIVALSIAALRRHYFFHSADSIRALFYRGGNWFLEIRNQQQAATLLPSSTVTNSLLVLNFRLDDCGKKADLVLLPDSAAADSLRQLKALLRISKLRRSSFPAAE